MPHSPESQNKLLASLPVKDWRRIKPHFEETPLLTGDQLFASGQPFRQLYFPIVGIVSSVAEMESGDTAGMATIGSEGMVGIGAILGSHIALSRHVVQVPGRAYVIRDDEFARWCAESAALRAVLNRYAQAFAFQILRSVACNAVHSAKERAARWLLTCHDSSGGDTFELTQQLIAELLGVSRPMVGTIACALQAAGLISYSRGVITVSDRRGLEEASCECYRVIRHAFEERGIGPASTTNSRE